MSVPVSRIIAVAMAGVLCFVLLVPMSLARHNVALAVFIAVVFFGYLIANIVLWQRMRRGE
ncbi:MAG TPA: hypothetical protein VGG70_07960 [Candidatus Cybelea sp.]|jgi:hypothetical protein